MKKILLILSMLYGVPSLAQPSPTSQIRPESFVRFPDSGVACVTKDALAKVMGHFLRGEATKANAMLMSNSNRDGPCIALNRQKKFKVLSIEYNDPESPDVGVMEIIGPGDKSSDGAWTLTLGSIPSK